MKKTALILSAAPLLLCGCGQAKKEESASSAATGFDPAAMKTMGDVFTYTKGEFSQEDYTETYYLVVFDAEGNYYRASTDLPKDVSDALFAIDFDDENKAEKVMELVSPLEVKALENLTEMMPSQEELNKYVGKTGKDLFDEGWEYSYYNLDDMEAGMYYGPFEYKVVFDYSGEPMVNSDDFDFYEKFKDIPVKSVECIGIGNASNLD